MPAVFGGSLAFILLVYELCFMLGKIHQLSGKIRPPFDSGDLFALCATEDGRHRPKLRYKVLIARRGLLIISYA